MSWSRSVPSCGASAMPIEASVDKLMAETLVGLPDRLMDPAAPGSAASSAEPTSVWIDREFVAAEPGDQVALLDAAA